MVTMLTARHRAGFTLLELLVVLVILGMLAAYVAPRYFGQVGKSEVRVAHVQMDALSKALDAYRADVGRYPTTQQGLRVLFERPPNLSRWQGPYLKKAVPDDPWGNPYGYAMPGANGLDYSLSSFGRDGRVGGTGEDADLAL